MKCFSGLTAIVQHVLLSLIYSCKLYPMHGTLCDLRQEKGLLCMKFSNNSQNVKKVCFSLIICFLVSRKIEPFGFSLIYSVYILIDISICIMWNVGMDAISCSDIMQLNTKKLFWKMTLSTLVYKSGHNSACDQYFSLKIVQYRQSYLSML